MPKQLILIDGKAKKSKRPNSCEVVVLADYSNEASLNILQEGAP